MSIFDLLFLFLVLACFLTLGAALVLAISGRRAQSFTILKRFVVCFLVYMAVVFAVALLKPQRIFVIGEKHCFDDWCISVSQAHRDGPRYEVALEISSDAKRVNQRANGAAVYLIDAQGGRFYPEPDASAVPLDAELAPGQKIETNRTFLVPADARGMGLVVKHGGSYCIPGCFIIGDDGNPLAKQTIVQLP
jgi:hypothetical protein